MKVQYNKGVANRLAPESCAVDREVCSEALTGETTGQPLSREIVKSGMQTQFPLVEGNTQQGATRESCCDPALSMSGSYLHRSWEVSSVSDGELSDGAGKGKRNPAIYAEEKSDAHIVPEKLPNKGQAPLLFEECSAEAVEGRGAAKGNAEESTSNSKFNTH